MIYIGYQDDDKRRVIADYQRQHAITRLVVISPKEFPLALDGADHNEFHDVIEYITFYRLLQEIDMHTLVVVNECLRTQNRYELTYNCIRNFLNQTSHKLIFQQLPIIDTVEDFMILFDFATRSQWKRRPFDADLVRQQAQVLVQAMPIAFECVSVATSAKIKEKYEADRDKLFAELGTKDPHTVPRNLYLIGGEDKRKAVDPFRQYVARNQRLNLPNVVTYDAASAVDAPYRIIELPHRFIDFSDFIQRTWQANHAVLVADLKVDHWYINRYQAWKERLYAAYASLHR